MSRQASAIDFGPPTAEEALKIEDLLASRALSAPLGQCSSDDFVSDLGWPQRRLPDVREHIAQNEELLKERLSARLKKRVTGVFMSRRHILIDVYDLSGKRLTSGVDTE